MRFYKMDFWAVKDGRVEDWKGKKTARQAHQHSVTYQQKQRIPRVDGMVGSLLLPGAKVLEVGCGYGETLAYLYKQYEAVAYAVEPSDDAVAYMNESHPYIEIIGRSAEELFDNHNFDAMFDFVIFSCCLANILDVNQMLATTRRLLRDDGRLYIDIANLYWSGAMNPYHPIVVTPETLLAFLHKHGFEMMRIDTDRPPANVLTDSLRRHKRWFNLLAVKAQASEGRPSPVMPRAEDVIKAFRVSRKVLALQARMSRLKRAITRRLRS
ncbi:MAG TPA: class I SAM-dependent methyltransferase [Blastocatellia bacterium]|nr:class I SAM-dependent methyltransferase [Blastocatellia bacterium]